MVMERLKKAKPNRFFGSALNITNRYRVRSSHLSKVSIALTKLKHANALPECQDDMVQSEAVPTLKYQPTYRLESQNPFNKDHVTKIIEEIVDKGLHGVEYCPFFAPDLAKTLSDDIKNRVKEENFDRYKIVCTVTIGEKFHQDLKAVAIFLWDQQKDSYASYVYEKSPFLIAIATVYAIYYD
jgi:hypothetical protein